MKALTEKILHYVVLIVVTIFAIGVMWRLSAKQKLENLADEVLLRPHTAVSAAKAPVAVTRVEMKLCEIVATYAGKIQPWETYQIGFPTAGRVAALGANAADQPLDEGDRVEAGQVLATMDDRVFRARKSEAAARIEQVTSDLQRAQRARQNNRTSVSDAELQNWVTDLAMARAQQEIAAKNLDDATLRSPVSATISKRMIKSGESVNPNQVVFELVENDQVLLVVDVPETQIRELEQRMRTVTNNRQTGKTDEDSIFRAHVQLEGRDRFGKSWPKLEGVVYRIPEVADPRTGLFPVEIQLANQERLLRPGMVATAEIVTARVPGYAIPEDAVIYRGRNAHLFTVERETADMELLYWNLGPTDLYRARRVDLGQWIDQGRYIIVPAEETQLQSVISRGQDRLADNQVVRIMNLGELSPGLGAQSAATSQTLRVATEP